MGICDTLKNCLPFSWYKLVEEYLMEANRATMLLPAVLCVDMNTIYAWCYRCMDFHDHGSGSLIELDPRLWGDRVGHCVSRGHKYDGLPRGAHLRRAPYYGFVKSSRSELMHFCNTNAQRKFIKSLKLEKSFDDQPTKKRKLLDISPHDETRKIRLGVFNGQMRVIVPELHTHQLYKKESKRGGHQSDTIIPKWSTDPQPSTIGSNLRPWQAAAWKILDDDPKKNLRKIYWIYDKEGQCGKITFLRWLKENMSCMVLTPCTRKEHLLYEVANNDHCNAYLINVPKSYSNLDETYTALEAIKSGSFTSNRSKAVQVEMASPHVWVLSHMRPDQTKLFHDRLVVWELCNKEFTFTQV